MTHVRIKVCGITRTEDIHSAVACGIDFLGFVFASSPRRLSLEAANRLLDDVPAGVGKVGLFMNQDADEVEYIVRNSYLDLLQFHGDEDNRFCASFGLPFIKAIAMQGNRDARMDPGDFPDAGGFVYDGHARGEAGGSGQTFDWRMLDCAETPVWLAGGLHAGNVGEAIAIVQPWAVDVSSGVETSPGVKDQLKISAFTAAVRRAEKQLTRKQDL